MASATVDPFTVEIVRNATRRHLRADGDHDRAHGLLDADPRHPDFSTALFDARGASSPRAPASRHLNTMGPALETVLARYLPAAEWQPATCRAHDPYHGAQHCRTSSRDADLPRGCAPRIRGCMGIRSTWEGARRAPSAATPPTSSTRAAGSPRQALRGGPAEPGVFDSIRTNIREPDKTMGDLASQVASLHVGERELRRSLRAWRGIIAARWTS